MHDHPPPTPDGIVTYRLLQPAYGAEGRIYEYAQDDAAASFSGGSGKVVFTRGGHGRSNKVIVSNGTTAQPVYVGIVILDADGQALNPLAIQLRRVAAARSGHDPQGRGTFPKAVAVPRTDSAPPMLILTDDDDDQANFEFDVLFTDHKGNYGLLDPKLENM